MTSKEAREKMDQALDRLAELIEAGRSDAIREYLATMSRFRKYSWGNQLLIYVQNPQATWVAGFNTWKQVGRWVKKGAKGIMILAPCKGSRMRTKQDENGQEIEVEDRFTTFRPVYVFDVAQTEGKDLPEPERVQGDVSRHLPRLEAFVRDEMGVTLVDSDALGAGCYGASSHGTIELAPGMEPAHRFAVLCHEVAHEVLHWDIPKEQQRDKTVVETQAEATAFVVCATLGLDPGTSASDYIQLYNGNRETLRQSLQAIQKAAGTILESLGGAAKAESAKERHSSAAERKKPAQVTTLNPRRRPLVAA